MKRRDTIVRYTAPERINHWITAFCFILAAVSGLGFLFPSFNWLMQIMGTYHGAYLRRPLGERHDYRHGGRMGYQRLGEETSPALVP